MGFECGSKGTERGALVRGSDMLLRLLRTHCLISFRFILIGWDEMVGN